MQGRYGVDAFSKFLLWVAVACVLLSSIFRNEIFSILSLALLIYSYMRIFSRNYQKRYAENQKYMEIAGRVKGFFKGNARPSIQARDKEHKIFKCPACGQKTRVPRGKGKIEIVCPRCGNKFIKRT